MIRIAINGYGRIGRCVLRALHERDLDSRIQVVAINDLADPKALAHLTRHDSTHGPLNVPVETDGDQMTVDGQNIRLLAESRLEELPWQALGVDLVLECTGKFKHRAELADHLRAGARRVLASHPVADPDRTLVYGINHNDVTEADTVVSNASCTTNCLAPVAQVLDEIFGVEHGQMTTIHAYTNDQALIDQPHADLYRARSAGSNMIPTSTGAARAVGKVLPHLEGRLDGMAVRVPTANVSLVDLHVRLDQSPSVEALEQAFRNAAAGELNGILAVNDEPLVSLDYNHRGESSIVDLPQLNVIGRQVKVVSWYDNEWGFANRMLDMTQHLAG